MLMSATPASRIQVGIRTRICINPPRPSTFGVSFKESDVVQPVPPFQRGSQPNSREARANTSNLAKGRDLTALTHFVFVISWWLDASKMWAVAGEYIVILRVVLFMISS